MATASVPTGMENVEKVVLNKLACSKADDEGKISSDQIEESLKLLDADLTSSLAEAAREVLMFVDSHGELKSDNSNQRYKNKEPVPVADEFWLVGSVLKHVNASLPTRCIFEEYATFEQLLMKLQSFATGHHMGARYRNQSPATVHILLCVGIPDIVPDDNPVGVVKNLNLLVDQLIPLKERLHSEFPFIINVTIAQVWPPRLNARYKGEVLKNFAQQLVNYAFRWFNTFTIIINWGNGSGACNIAIPFYRNKMKYKLKTSALEDDGIMPTVACAQEVSENIDKSVSSARCNDRYCRVFTTNDNHFLLLKSLWDALLKAEQMYLKAYVSKQADIKYHKIDWVPHEGGHTSDEADAPCKELDVDESLLTVFKSVEAVVAEHPTSMQHKAAGLLTKFKQSEKGVYLTRQLEDLRRVAEFRKKVELLERKTTALDPTSSVSASQSGQGYQPAEDAQFYLD